MNIFSKRHKEKEPNISASGKEFLTNPNSLFNRRYLKQLISENRFPQYWGEYKIPKYKKRKHYVVIPPQMPEGFTFIGNGFDIQNAPFTYKKNDGSDPITLYGDKYLLTKKEFQQLRRIVRQIEKQLFKKVLKETLNLTWQ